jgi:His/Glu/Gln/Arg/opine family amino acid ABC transporter permease subunit
MAESFFDSMYRYVPLLAKVAWMSLQVLLWASILSVCIGTWWGVLTSNRLRNPVVGVCLDTAAFILRAVPFYVQLLIVYFVIPDLLGLNVDGFFTSIIALGICSAGYMTQVVRCGINSISREQWEAASALGFSRACTLRHIILPQMMRNILPAITNEIEALLKSTSILSSIGLLELTRVGMNIVSRELAPLTVYLSVALFYVVISAAIITLSRYLERRLQLC